MNKLYIHALCEIKFDENVYVFNVFPNYIIIGKDEYLNDILSKNAYKIKDYYYDKDSNNPLLDYDDYSIYKARIEKGAVIRKNVTLADSAIILMGAIINMGASIGENTLIDMNAVIGSGAIIKNNVHISAGAVISGVLEPISNNPVIIEDDVFIGANSTIKEGVHIKKGAIIGANSYVSHDVEENSLCYGAPAKFIRKATNDDYEKLAINKSLRR